MSQSHVTYHLSHVTCHMSKFVCHMSGVTCLLTTTLCCFRCQQGPGRFGDSKEMQAMALHHPQTSSKYIMFSSSSSHVLFHLSCVSCHMSPVTCHPSPTTIATTTAAAIKVTRGLACFWGAGWHNFPQQANGQFKLKDLSGLGGQFIENNFPPIIGQKEATLVLKRVNVLIK